MGNCTAKGTGIVMIVTVSDFKPTPLPRKVVIELNETEALALLGLVTSITNQNDRDAGPVSKFVYDAFHALRENGIRQDQWSRAGDLFEDIESLVARVGV